MEPEPKPQRTRESIYEADLDWSITQSLKLTNEHRTLASLMLRTIFIIFIALILFVIGFTFLPIKLAVSPVISYVIYGICIISISIFTSLYKQHSLDASKAENIYFAFLRIRVAGKSGGYGTEVRTALTERAFDFVSDKGSIFSKSKKIESPIPGHLGFDLSTKIVNAVLKKVLDNIEVKKKKDDDDNEGDEIE